MSDQQVRISGGWIAGLIVAAALAVLVGASIWMFLLIGIAMGGDALGAGYADWATAAIALYPTVIIVIVLVMLIWAFRTKGPKADTRRIIAIVLILLSVPIAIAVALGLTFIGMSLNQ